MYGGEETQDNKRPVQTVMERDNKLNTNNSIGSNLRRDSNMVATMQNLREHATSELAQEPLAMSKPVVQ